MLYVFLVERYFRVLLTSLALKLQSPNDTTVHDVHFKIFAFSPSVSRGRSKRRWRLRNGAPDASSARRRAERSVDGNMTRAGSQGARLDVAHGRIGCAFRGATGPRSCENVAEGGRAHAQEVEKQRRIQQFDRPHVHMFRPMLEGIEESGAAAGASLARAAAFQ